MKNQYFGDVNDYRKYGLLRSLSNNGQYHIGVCWMLTADDGQTDGKFTNYLNSPKNWRQYDPLLFDQLSKWIQASHIRNVKCVEGGQTLPGANFYSELLSDSLSQRTAYFAQAKERLAKCDLVFYDPDNGIETRSIIKGQRHSSKYIYWDEVQETFKAGHSVMIYQHFRREERRSFIQRLVGEYQARLDANKVYWFQTPQVVYFLSVQKKHADFIASQTGLVAKRWGNQIQVG